MNSRRSCVALWEIGHLEVGKSEQTLSIGVLRKACSTCSLQELCLPMGLDDNGLEELEQVVETLGPLHRGDYLFHQGHAFKALYVVRSGYLKAYALSESGEEHVLGFFMSGELLGLDSISSNRKQCSATVLDTSMVCRLPFDELSIICIRVPALQRQLLRLMSRELMSTELLSARHSADSRMATFLLDWGERLARRGFSARHFILPMSRQDIGNYLQMAPETVSRCFTRFDENGWIQLKGRELQLTDLPVLAALRSNVG